MHWLIETKEQLEKLSLKDYKNIFLEIIPFSNKLHPTQNQINCFYLHPVNFKKGYIINISHDEGFKLELENVKNYLKSYDNIFVKDKKEFLHYLILPNLKDITFSTPEFNIDYTTAHSFIYNKFPEIYNINNLVSLSKHYEFGYNLFKYLRKYCNIDINPFYNDKSTLVFYYLEKNGIKVDPILYEKYFGDSKINKVYTQYNLKTLTRRPSNHFNNVNFAALNKKNGERSCFIPENDSLLEIDISAYHPTLLSNMVNHKFLTDDIHKELASLYNVDYQKSKQITFQQIYGGVFPQYKDIEFFQKVTKYTEELWDKFNNEGKITCKYSNYIFYQKDLTNMNPQKLLNYYLQNLETSLNVCILWDIIQVLKNKKTKLILYTYDSFLLDYDVGDKEEIKQIIQIFKKYNLKIKHNYGKNYDFK